MDSKDPKQIQKLNKPRKKVHKQINKPRKKRTQTVFLAEVSDLGEIAVGSTRLTDEIGLIWVDLGRNCSSFLLPALMGEGDQGRRR